MDNEALIRTFSVLGQETRLSIYRLLCEFGDQGGCPSDIAEKLGVAAATLSFHLKTLTQAGLLDAEADGRFIRYRANHQPTREMVRFVAKHLCGLSSPAPAAASKPKRPAPAKPSPQPEPIETQQPSAEQPQQRQLFEPAAPAPEPAPGATPPTAPATPAPDKSAVKPKSAPQPSRIRLRPLRILYLSPGNAARGLMAEALTNDLGDGRFQGLSAGSQPLGRVNRYALKQLELAGHQVEQLRSKSWEEFVAADAAEIDLLIGLWSQDSAPTYPRFPGRCQRAYWPISDPSTVTSSVGEAERAFAQCYQSIRDRIEPLLKRLGEQLDKATAAAIAPP